jgi:carbonic anhydrase
LGGLDGVKEPHLQSWLRHGSDAVDQLRRTPPDPSLKEHNRLSQINVLAQLRHLETYALIQQRMKRNQLRLHGWWFDIAQADVYHYETSQNRFLLIDEAMAAHLVERLKPPSKVRD